MKSLTVQQIAKRLKHARREKGMTQKELATLLSIPQSYIAKIESGGTDLRCSTLMDIARLLDLELLFVSLEDMPRVKCALADDAEMIRQQVFRSAYVPDEDRDDEESY